MKMYKRMLPVLAAVVMGTGCRSDKFEQVDLGELPTPVLIRTVMWNVDGFRRADGTKDVAAFAKVLKEAKPDFVALTGVGADEASVRALARETGLIASVGMGAAVLSRIAPEEVWREHGSLVVEQPDFSITVIDFTGEATKEHIQEAIRWSPRGKVEFVCASPYFRKGTAAWEIYDAKYRTIAEGIGVVRTWGAGGFTFSGEEHLGGATFRNKAHLVVVKD